MSTEQQKHQEEYLIAKKRYENAFSEKRQAENEINTILNRRQHIIGLINELAAERKRNSESLFEIQKTYAQDSDFTDSIKDTDSKLEEASSAFLAIGASSVGSPQNLTEVFDERNRGSKLSIATAFEQMKKVGGLIQQKIEDIGRQISQYEQELEDDKDRERCLHNVIIEQDHIMNNALIEMAYHKNHMVS